MNENRKGKIIKKNANCVNKSNEGKFFFCNFKKKNFVFVVQKIDVFYRCNQCALKFALAHRKKNQKKNEKLKKKCMAKCTPLFPLPHSEHTNGCCFFEMPPENNLCDFLQKCIQNLQQQQQFQFQFINWFQLESSQKTTTNNSIEICYKNRPLSPRQENNFP